MLSILLIIAILLTIWGCKRIKKLNQNQSPVMFILSVISLLIISSCIIIAGVKYSNSLIINDKIDLYVTENNKIENQVENAVISYENYEKGTLEKFDFSDNMEIIFARYPELKTDNLIVEQISLYKENNQKIKELKEERLSYKLYGWWLFFNIGVEK